MLPAFSPSLGKTIREGMGQATGMPDSETLDCIITNALIVDWQGIYKVRPDVLSFFDFKPSRALRCAPRVHKHRPTSVSRTIASPPSAKAATLT